MTRTAIHSVVGWIVFGLTYATPAILPLAHAEGRLWLVVEPSEGVPTCQEFYDKWEVAGAPGAMMAMFGLGREVMAAKDCLDKDNVAMACKHWQGLLAVMDKMGPPLDESRGDLEKLMSEHKCEVATDAGANPAPETAPGSEPAADAEASPAAPASDTHAESPAVDK